MSKKAISLVLALIMCAGMLPTLGLQLSADTGISAQASYTNINWTTPAAVGDAGGYPRMEKLPDGTLLLASSSTNKILRLMRSNDGGATWGESETIVDYTDTEYLPANSYLYYDKVTETLYFTYRCPIEYKDSAGNITGYTSNINYLTSTDGGRTWSDIKTVCSSSVPNQEKYGGMWEPTIYRTDGKLRIYYSCDVVKYGSGQLTLNTGTEYEKIDKSFPYSESKVTQNIVMHELDEKTGAWSGGVAVFAGYSDSLSEEYGFPAGTVKMRAGMQSISRLSDGTYVMAVETTKLRNWGDYGGTDFPMVIDVCFSRDGVNFTEPRTVAQGHADGYTSAAPWVVTLPDGRIAVSFQTDDFHDQPMPTEAGNYKQLQVVISKEAVSYDDASEIDINDFERYCPFDVYNTEVTFNYWNALFIDGYTLYVVGNHNTNDKKVTPAKGMLISKADLRPTTGVPVGYAPIYTANDMLNLMNRESGYSWADKYVLMNDIDLSEATIGLEQTSIGTDAGEYTSFSGIFDGNGKTLYGLDIEGSDKFTGLFGHTTDATVRNLTVRGSISSSYQGSSRYDNGCGVVGCAAGGTWVQNVTSYVSVTSNGTAGGIVGFANKDSNTSRNLIVQNCTNHGAVISTAAKSNGAAGGIVGSTVADKADITVRECVNYGSVSGPRYVGGIVGGTQHNTDAGIFYTKAVKCRNFAPVSSSGNDCGGIFGLAYYATAENCLNYGDVSSKITTKTAYVGGIVGRAHVYVDISGCYSDAEQSEYGHGVLGSVSLGKNVTVTNCYFGRGLEDEFAQKVEGEAASRFASYPGLDFLNTFEIKDGVVYLIDRSIIRMGDVNANKTIDNTDMTLLIRKLAGWSNNKVNEAYCDMNGDGKINNRDAVILSQKLAGWQV